MRFTYGASRLAIVVGLCIATGHAAIDFYGYKSTYQWHDQTYRLTQTRLGSVQLEACEITVDPKGSYFDVIEDSWVSGNLQDQNVAGLLPMYMFKGAIDLPTEAAVTGLTTWKNGTMFRSELYPASYNFTQTVLDSAALARMFDKNLARLQQLSPTRYEFMFSNVDLGERRHIRIRYLLPNTASPQSQVRIPVVCHPGYGTTPRTLNLTVLADNGRRSYNLVTNSGSIVLHDSSTVAIPYAGSVALVNRSPARATVHSTTLTDASIGGTYLQVNAAIDDTLLRQLSNTIETIFIWRWNGPQSMIAWSQQVKTLSSYANSVLSQSGSMVNCLDTLNARGYRTGLIHSIEGAQTNIFSLSAPGDTGSKRIMNYLTSFTRQSLYTTYKDSAVSSTPEWIPYPVGTQSEVQKQGAQLLTLLQQAKNQFSATPGIRKHIVIISAGDVSYGYNTVTRRTMDSLLADTMITVDHQLARWRGIDFNAVFPNVYEQKLTWWQGYRFPLFEPTTVQLKLFTANQPFAMPITLSESRHAFVSIKSSSAWENILQWTGFDNLGNVTNAVTTTATVTDVEHDVGLAKLWARNPNHLAEREEDLYGARYGIVTKATFLRAGLEQAAPSVEEGIPFLEANEIHITKVAMGSLVNNAVRVSFHLNKGSLALRVPQKFGARILELYDMRGRLLLRVNLQAYRAGEDSFRIPLDNLLTAASRSVVVAKVIGAGHQQTFTMNIGGAL